LEKDTWFPTIAFFPVISQTRDITSEYLNESVSQRVRKDMQSSPQLSRVCGDFLRSKF
jgi:hypothetical protein